MIVQCQAGFAVGVLYLWGPEDVRERKAALNLAANLHLPAQPLNSETLNFAIFREVPVKIRAKSVVNLHFEQPSFASEPKYSLGSSGACFRCIWTWQVKQEYLCPGRRGWGCGLWQGISRTCLSLAEAA